MTDLHIKTDRILKATVTTLFTTATMLLLNPPTIEAQQLKASLSHYSTDDGLASNAVSCIRQDDYGYVWIATWNGLSRFDGFSFYNYDTGSASGISMLHNRIIDIATDQQQNIWMRMYDGRIFVLNRITDTIENPLRKISGYRNFKTSQPLTITSAGDVMAVIDGVGIYCMRLDRNGMKTKLIDTGKLTVTSIAEGYRDDIWVGTDNGIHRLNMNNDNIERNGFFPDEHIKCMYSNGYNIYAGTQSGHILSFAYGQEPKTIKEMGQTISSIFVDSHGLMWFTTDKQGVSRMNMETGDVKDFTQKVAVPEYDVRGAKISEVNHTVWINMNHGGFGYYNRETDNVEYFHNDPTNSWNLSNTVATYLALPEGVVWESTIRKGLEKLELLKQTIHRRQLFSDNNEVNLNEIRAIHYDVRSRQLLMGNKYSNLIFMTPDDSVTSIISDDGSGHMLGRIYGINRDRDGNYWICSKGTGVIRIAPDKDNSTGRFTFFTNDRENPASLSSNNAYRSVEDKNGNIWVATYGGGVNIITKDGNGRYVALNNRNVMRHYPRNSYHKVRTMAIDKEGNVWAGTTDGLLIMSYSDNKIRMLRVSETTNGERDLKSKDIVTLACDADGSMWIGTNGGGLSHTVGKDENGNWLFETFDIKSGLPSEEIKSITFDEKGNVWLATDHMICSFDVKKRIFSTFSMLDGVDDTIFSEGAAITMPDGNIIFGTLNGYYIVDRKKLSTQTGSMLKLKITDFYMDGILMSPRLNGDFNAYVPDCKEVNLPDADRNISFRFAALNYQLQHRVHYQYMMEGIDSEWKNADKSRTATYAGLKPGKHRFMVKAFLLESPDNYDIRTIDVIVPRDFMFSYDAVWIYMVIISALILTGMYLYQERLKKSSEKLGKLK